MLRVECARTTSSQKREAALRRVFKADRLSCHPTLGSKVMKKRKRLEDLGILKSITSHLK